MARHFAAIFETVEPISFDVDRMIAQDDAVATFVRVKARVRAHLLHVFHTVTEKLIAKTLRRQAGSVVNTKLLRNGA